jgi:hypothetical protein
MHGRRLANRWWSNIVKAGLHLQVQPTFQLSPDLGEVWLRINYLQIRSGFVAAVGPVAFACNLIPDSFGVGEESRELKKAYPGQQTRL